MAHSCGLGFVLYLSYSHYMTSKCNLGHGTNNQGEFNALFSLLKFIVDINISSLQVYGDSELTIKWMNDKIHVTNLVDFIFLDN
jgi:ribonuclease HI